MEKEFIPYEQALALKQLGFDEECFGAYHNENNLDLWSEDFDYSYVVKAPLYQQVFRWFRENHNMSGEIGINVMEDDEYCYEIGDVKTRMCIDEDSFSTHKQAEIECLKKLIEQFKNK